MDLSSLLLAADTAIHTYTVDTDESFPGAEFAVHLPILQSLSFVFWGGHACILSQVHLVR